MLKLGKSAGDKNTLWPSGLSGHPPRFSHFIIARNFSIHSKMDVSSYSRNSSQAENFHATPIHKLRWVTLGYHHDWDTKVRNCVIIHPTIKPEVSRTLFVRYLLSRLQTDWRQTWQGGRARTQKGPCRTRFHGNHHVAMATKKMVFLWLNQDSGWISDCLWCHNLWRVIIYDIICVTSPWQWCHGNHQL